MLSLQNEASQSGMLRGSGFVFSINRLNLPDYANLLSKDFIGPLLDRCKIELPRTISIINDSAILVDYNVSVLANGYFYSRQDSSSESWDFQSISGYNGSWNLLDPAMIINDTHLFSSISQGEGSVQIVTVDRRWSAFHIIANCIDGNVPMVYATCFLAMIAVTVRSRVESVRGIWIISFSLAAFLRTIAGIVILIEEPRTAAGIFTNVPPDLLLVLGVKFYESKFVTILFVFTILYVFCIFIHDIAIEGKSIGSYVVDVADSSAAVSTLFGISIVVLRTRDLHVASSQVFHDKIKYDEIWSKILSLPGSKEAINRLNNVLVEIRKICRRLSSFRQLVVVIQGIALESQAKIERSPSLQINLLKGIQALKRTASQKFGQQSISKPVTSLDQLYLQAFCLDQELRRKVQYWALACNGYFPIDNFHHERKFAKVTDIQQNSLLGPKWGQIKSLPRAIEKVLRVYGQVCLFGLTKS